MSNLISALTSRVAISHLVIGTFLIFLPLSVSYAKAGCCSRHHGVAGCNVSTGYQQCKDGTNSPTCKCEASQGAATTVTPKKVKTTTTTTVIQPTTTTAPTTATPTAITTTKTKITGCCSRHGGVAKCDTTTGYQLCKDGTHSSTCTCAKQ